MRTKCKSLFYSLGILAILCVMPANNILAKDFPLIEATEIPSSGDFWQDGYDYGYYLGKFYSVSAQVYPGWVNVVDYIDYTKCKIMFKRAKIVVPLTDHYKAMADIFTAELRRSAGDSDRLRYYDGALNGLYDGFRYNAINPEGPFPGGGGTPGGGPKVPGDITENPHQP